MTSWSDKKFLLISGALALFIAIAPYAIGQAITPRGAMFYGNRVVAPVDFSIYYSYIVQGGQGHVFMEDVFTSELHQPTIFQPLWFVVGQAQRAFHVSVPTAFALARYLTIPIFLLTLWWAAGWLWPHDRFKRRTGFILSLIASGLGGMAVGLTASSGTETIWRYPDLWVSEAYSVLTLWSSPHFLLVTSGIVFVLVATERSWLERRWSWAVWAGAAALAVFAIHPFHVLTWLMVWVISSAWRWTQDRRLPWEYIRRWLLVIAMGSPALLFYAMQLLTDPITIGRAIQNINLTDRPIKMIIGIGLPLLLAGWGAFRWRPRDDRWRWALALALSYLMAVYLPVAFQRRLSQGLMLPFAWLSVPAAVWIIQKTYRWSCATTIMIVLAVVLILSSTWISVGGLMVKDYIDDLRVPRRMYYLGQEHREFLAALDAQDRHQPMLGTLIESNIAAGLTAHQVYVGYGVETLRFAEKFKNMGAFYSSMSEQQQRDLLAKEKLCFVMTSPRTRAYGSAFQPSTWTDLEHIWSGPTLDLYRTAYCR